MELSETINKRCSIRNYNSKEIKKEDLIYIFNSARLAPSAHNKQPWEYLILTGNNKEKFLNMLEENINSKDENTQYEKIFKKSIPFIREAYAYVLVFSCLEENSINDYLSIGASVENALLAATDRGISSLWVGVILEFSKLINDHYSKNGEKLVTSFVLGYSDDPYFERSRKSLEEIVKLL